MMVHGLLSCRGAVSTALLAGPVDSVPGCHACHEADCRTTGCLQLLEGGTHTIPCPEIHH